VTFVDTGFFFALTAKDGTIWHPKARGLIGWALLAAPELALENQ
jgi:hypothetical protein